MPVMRFTRWPAKVPGLTGPILPAKGLSGAGYERAARADTAREVHGSGDPAVKIRLPRRKRPEPLWRDVKLMGLLAQCGTQSTARSRPVEQ